MILVAQLFSLEEMEALQDVSVLTSVWIKRFADEGLRPRSNPCVAHSMCGPSQN